MRRAMLDGLAFSSFDSALACCRCIPRSSGVILMSISKLLSSTTNAGSKSTLNFFRSRAASSCSSCGRASHGTAL